MSASPATVVLDACVLVPAALRDTLLRAAQLNLYSVHWSEDILTELERTLVGEGMASAIDARRLISVMREAFPLSTIHNYESMIELMTNHEKDRHVVAAAVVAGADTIVTLNLSDFPAESLEPWRIEAQSPDAFLAWLYHNVPYLLQQVITDQAADLQNPPQSIDEVLMSLSRTAPMFADLVRRDFI